MRDDIGDRMKLYENVETSRTLDPRQPIYARLDGRSFSTLTKGLQRPYDDRMSAAMLQTTMHLVESTHALIGYTQSDEISLMWNYADPAMPVFGGKIQKMSSVLAGMASAAFIMSLQDWGLGDLVDRLPHFDCRVLNIPNKTEATNMILWRSQDATRNAITMAAAAEFSHKQLEDVSTRDRLDLLREKGINFESYPEYFKWGRFVRRVTKYIEVTEGTFGHVPVEHRPPAGSTVMRSVMEEVKLPERFSMVSNREQFIFDGQDPYLGWNGV